MKDKQLTKTRFVSFGLISFMMLIFGGCPGEDTEPEPCKAPSASGYPLSTNKKLITITGDKDPGLNGTRVWLQLDTWDEPRPADGAINGDKTWSIDVELEEGTNQFVLLQETNQGFCPEVTEGATTIVLDSRAPVFCRALNYPNRVIVQPGESAEATVSGDREKGSIVLIDDVERVDNDAVQWETTVSVVEGVNDFVLTCED